ncbi:hypothetical protein PENFLA_c001G04173 [Penicillium flavigenum]|uniref:Uncharacterized protein n=1 Tax=Penicillium flavigenum TaxID=254877 RepID=A0A1V6U299_9EURO|nr:hypothetical protein PENFLA_c091G07520 [Penicillium flavigenum]OQE32474.1 hypothetical protein PENFLA_c001G04173 [Penicillium flavigenum]
MAAAQQLDKDLERLLCELTCSLSGNEVQFFSAECETCFQRLSIDEKELFRRLLGKLLKTAQGGLEASQPSACSRTFSEETTRNDNADERPTSTNAILAPVSHSASLENTNDACVDSAVVVDASTDSILAATNFVHVQSIIPTFIRHLLVSCIDTPGYFFTASEPHFSPIQGGVPDAFYRLYQKEGCRDLLEIHRRFELRNLLLLVVDLGYHTGEKWVWGALNDLPAEIKAQSPLLTLTTPEIKKYLDHYVRLGRAYDKWVQMFGDPGYLIALPLMVSETE